MLSVGQQPYIMSYETLQSHIDMPCAALPSGATGIISLVFGIMFWAQYGNVKDTCEGEGSEDFDKISRVFTLAIINFCYGTVNSVRITITVRQTDTAMMRP
jgi:hypothetical protein